jgi:hypothetical protein
MRYPPRELKALRTPRRAEIREYVVLCVRELATWPALNYVQKAETQKNIKQ